MATIVEALAEIVNGQVHGDGSLPIEDAESIERAGSSHVTYAGDEANLKKLAGGNAGAAFLTPELFQSLQGKDRSFAVIVADDPQGAFIAALEHFRPRRGRKQIGISPAANVSPTARIGAGTNIHPGAHVGDDVVIGAACDIYPGVVVSPGCTLGDEVLLYPNVVLYADVSLGDRVTIHASTVIGADGFGYRIADGRHQKIPHFGTVRIENDVEIGSCTTVDRAMIGATVIGEGTKLDNLVMIAHNCELGRHNALVAQVGLAGSVTTGDYVVCAGQVGIADHVHLGDGCVLGSKAGVHKDIPAGETQIGAPSQPAQEAMKVFMSTKKLPELRKAVRDLQTQVLELTSKLDSFEAAGRDSGGSENLETAA